jgi:hypothetical protein
MRRGSRIRRSNGNDEEGNLEVNDLRVREVRLFSPNIVARLACRRSEKDGRLDEGGERKKRERAVKITEMRRICSSVRFLDICKAWTHGFFRPC